MLTEITFKASEGRTPEVDGWKKRGFETVSLEVDPGGCISIDTNNPNGTIDPYLFGEVVKQWLRYVENE